MKFSLKGLGLRTGSDAGSAPWYVEAFLAVGGWIAGLLAFVAIFALSLAVFGVSATAKNGVGVAWFGLIAGLGFVLAGLLTGRSGRAFGRHFSIALVGGGLTAFAAGFAWMLSLQAFGNDGPREIGASLLATSVAHALVAAFAARRLKDPILTFLATLGWFGLVVASLFLSLKSPAWAGPSLAIFAALCAAAGAIVSAGIGGKRMPALGAALLTAPIIAGVALQYTIGAANLTSGYGAAAKVIYAVAVLACLVALKPRTPSFGLGAAGAVLLAFIWLLPNSGAAAVLALVAGMAGSSRALVGVGVIALAAFISRYYNDLSMPLLHKSALLGGLGVATIGVAEGMRRFGKSLATESSVTPRAPRRSLAAALAFGALLTASALLVNKGVVQLERDFIGARTVYFPLAPVDPRSLVQGDYMALRFDDRLFPPETTTLARSGEAFLALDARAVASFSRVARNDEQATATEIRVDYRRDRDHTRYCPESFFFQEGEAEIFSRARFAAIKIAPDGKTRLFALADENLQIISPGLGDDASLR